MKKIFLIMVLVLSMLSVVFAAPLPPVDNFAGGLTLELNDYAYHPINTEYYLHLHLYVTDSGVVSNNNESECFYHLYAERVNWQHLIFNGTMQAVGVGFEATINESYFNETGDYSYLIWCDEPIEPNAKQGGYEKLFFTVYEDEKEFNYFYEIVGLIIIAVLLLVAVLTNQNILGIITSIILVITSLYYMFDTFLIGLLMFIAGVFLTMYFGFKDGD